MAPRLCPILRVAGFFAKVLPGGSSKADRRRPNSHKFLDINRGLALTGTNSKGIDPSGKNP